MDDGESEGESDDDGESSGSSIQATVDGPDPYDRVSVPQNAFNPCTQLKDSLQLAISRSPSDDFGKSKYTQAVDIVGTHLIDGCSSCT